MAVLWSVRQAQAADFIQSIHASHSEQVLHSRRATVLSWLGWCRERGYDGSGVPAWAKRLAVPDSETPARSRMTIDDVLELGGRARPRPAVSSPTKASPTRQPTSAPSGWSS